MDAHIDMGNREDMRRIIQFLGSHVTSANAWNGMGGHVVVCMRFCVVVSIDFRFACLPHLVWCDQNVSQNYKFPFSFNSKPNLFHLNGKKKEMNRCSIPFRAIAVYVRPSPAIQQQNFIHNKCVFECLFFTIP